MSGLHLNRVDAALRDHLGERMTTAVDTRIPADDIAAIDTRARRAGPRRRLFAKYAAALVGLVSLVLLINGSLDIWFSYDEAKDAAIRLQREKADAAAQRIEEFIAEIERQIGWTTATQWASSPIEQRRFDFGRLQRQVPAITELIQLDGQGHEQLKVSRLSMDLAGGGADYSADPRFTEALAKKVWFGPVYFRKESEPYMTMAVAQSGRNAGVTVAEVNLKLIWDVITAIKIGKTGYAYVVDDKGRLIAHPDISRVLRNTDLSGLPQVAAARGTSAAAFEPAEIVRNLDGRRVLSASAAIPRLGWLVFVEQPISKALAPLYTSVLNTGLLLLLGLVVAVLAGLLLARRMTGPIRALDAGAARIGAGALDHRITVHTGDELEELAERFNTMAADLQSSYADLEKKVEDRTAELKEALDQQTATAEVLQVINSSPGDLRPVFDAMLEKALSLCDAASGALFIRDGEQFYAVATAGLSVEFSDFVRKPFAPARDSTLRDALRGEAVIHITDAAQLPTTDNPQREALIEQGGARTELQVALRKDSVVLGAIRIFRQEVRPFSDRQIALLRNFAAQAVIAMENARLLTETREALEQQTATAEVLQVINSSPGDITPVFDAILEKAHSLCGAARGALVTFDGEWFRAVATRRCPEPFAEMLRRGFPLLPGSPAEPLVRGEHVHILDFPAFAAASPLEVARLARTANELAGTRTLLMVPLRKDGALLGYIAGYRQEVRPFSDKQIALLENFAAQAVIAMENARLMTETREALEKQTATAEILRVISGSPTDLQPTFDAIAASATILSGAASGVFRFDGSLIHLVAHHGNPPDVLQAMQHSFPRPPGRQSTTTRAVLTREVVHIPDVAADPDYALPSIVQTGWRTALSVPILQDGNPVGAITVVRRQVEPFSQAQIDLLKTFADQAVIAIENVRLFTELGERTRDLQESLEYQTATSDVLKVISQSTFDLQPVLETLAGTASRLCEAQMAFIFRREGDLYRVAASVGFSPETKALVEANPISPGRSTVAARTALTASVVHIPDTRLDPEYTWGEFIRVAKTPTMLGVPLLREGVPVGVIVLARERVEPFSEKQIELVRTFADQAVIAIENARLFNELHARTAELGRSVEELKMLSEVGQAVSSTLDLRSVLSAILTASLGVTWANAGAVFRYARADRSFRLVEAVGWNEALAHTVRELRVGETESAMGEAVARRMPIQLPDIAQRPSPLRDLTLAAGFHSALIVPLVGAERILGAIILMRKEAGEFPAETVRLMQTLASQSVLAIQNARLFREIADKSEQLALASQHKSQFLANMSHELRTPLNAILGYAELLVDGIYGVLPDRPNGVLERIQNNGRHLLALINDVLDLAKIEAGQLTLTLEDYPLPEVVRSVVTSTEPLATSKGLKFTAAVQDEMPMAHGDARRVSQVLLNLVGNAIKFTDAGEVEIRAACANGQFTLTVRDTGPGIADADQERIFGEFQQIDNSNTRQKGGTGLGLAISKRMVELQGGTISVESALGQGSTFRVVLPVHVDEMMEAAE
jgi:signal transduction histidine kinase/putative methionine-R-sulfoxide reductase with GAF domain